MSLWLTAPRPWRAAGSRAAASRSRPALLWLDGLERYLEFLGGNTLDEIAEEDPRLTVVATIRKKEYEEALEGTDEASRAARYLLGAAQGFSLPDKLNAQERGDAERLYPGIDFTQPVGVALGPDWSSGFPPQAEGQGASATRPWVRGTDGQLAVFSALAAACCVLAIVAFALAGKFKKPKAPTIGKQLAEIKTKQTTVPRVGCGTLTSLDA